jgi:hypothetical protein
MAKNTLNLADATERMTCLQTLRNNIEFFPEAEIEGPDGKGDYPVVSFTTTKGTGSGAQKLVAGEFGPLVGVLRSKLDSNFEEVEQTGEYRTAAQIAEDTLCLVAIDPETEKPSDDDDAEPTHVQFRVREGKGAKPARIPLAEAEEVIAYLESRVAKVGAVLAQMAEDADAEDGEDDGEGSDE